MMIKHATLAAALLSVSLATFANDIGTLSATPVVQTLRIEAQDLSFNSRTFFSLDLDSWFYAAAQSSTLSMAGSQVLGTENFSMRVVNVDNQVMQTVTTLGDALSIDSLKLLAGRYALQISGDTTGSMGGQYEWSLMAKAAPSTGIEVILPAVPEPSTLVLGMFALLPLWRVARQQRAKAVTQAAMT